MAATATPTSSPARSTCSRRWTHVQKHYPIDENRIVDARLLDGRRRLLAVRRPLPRASGPPRRRAPASPRRPTSSRSSRTKPLKPTWYEQKLWHLYDCTDYAVNLFNCPTVAYSGEIDRQKQAADMMAKALEKEGIELVHIIGPKTGHALPPEGQGGDQPPHRQHRRRAAATRCPTDVRFTTWTLRYNRSLWVTVDGLEQALGAGHASMPSSLGAGRPVAGRRPRTSRP